MRLSEPRVLGRSGLPVSSMGLGTAALGRPAYINLGHAEDLLGATAVEALERRAHDVLDAAWDAGVAYVDAARSYGRAEAFVASWLRAHDPGADRLTVGSKWGYRYVGGWRLDVAIHEEKAHTVERLDEQWQESAALLGDRIGLYQIHSATVDSGVLDDPGVLTRLARLREQGVAIGASTSGPRQGATIDRLVEARVDGVPLFDAVQATWNLLEPSAGPALAAAHSAGLGVIVKEAVANGRLTDREPELAARLRAAGGPLAPDAVAIAAALAQPWATVVLSGAATVAQLRSNLAALDVPADVVDAAGRLGLAEDPGAYWATRSELPWT